jgi:hypothetical protein
MNNSSYQLVQLALTQNQAQQINLTSCARQRCTAPKLLHVVLVPVYQGRSEWSEAVAGVGIECALQRKLIQRALLARLTTRVCIIAQRGVVLTPRLWWTCLDAY